MLRRLVCITYNETPLVYILLVFRSTTSPEYSRLALKKNRTIKNIFRLKVCRTKFTRTTINQQKTLRGERLSVETLSYQLRQRVRKFQQCKHNVTVDRVHGLLYRQSSSARRESTWRNIRVHDFTDKKRVRLLLDCV